MWEEAEKDGASKDECVRLRRRLGQAEQDREDALAAIEIQWNKQEDLEKKIRSKKIENAIRRKYNSSKGKRELKADTKMMRWTFHLLPQVNPMFTGFDKISYKDCRDKIMQEWIDQGVKIEMKKVKKEYKKIRKEENKFIREEVLKDPWEEGKYTKATQEHCSYNYR